MCRKVKDIKKEEIERLREKYTDVINGKIELNIHKISNFVNLVIPTLAEQFKDQALVRYLCLFSNCIPQKKSFKTKQKFVQHLCLKHAHQLPGQGLFLLSNDKSIQYGGFKCDNCSKIYTRKDHFQRHKSLICLTKQSTKPNKNQKKQQVIEASNSTITLDESFASCRLVDISLDESSVICLDD
ncbi:unnamed protein product [Brachionus calyciflorus]|uniref:C2H2-type domain-containing protein n=1 Tax=Brachionus calyciflorus TaxID=104777 RepID=A0A814F2N1_9BILA|nr:unnamed protein product [Brachionus calyciflorus]